MNDKKSTASTQKKELVKDNCFKTSIFFFVVGPIVGQVIYDSVSIYSMHHNATKIWNKPYVRERYRNRFCCRFTSDIRMYVYVNGLAEDGRRDEEYLNWLTCNVCLSLYESRRSLCQWQWKYSWQNVSLASLYIQCLTRVFNRFLLSFWERMCTARVIIWGGVWLSYSTNYYSYWILSKKLF